MNNNPSVKDIHDYCRVAADLAVEDGFCKEVDEFLLHEALDRARSVLRFITLGTHIVLEFPGELYCNPVL